MLPSKTKDDREQGRQEEPLQVRQERTCDPSDPASQPTPKAAVPKASLLGINVNRSVSVDQKHKFSMVF